MNVHGMGLDSGLYDVMQVLPIFNMTLPRHNSHFGSFGQGVAEGHADCLHW